MYNLNVLQMCQSYHKKAEKKYPTNISWEPYLVIGILHEKQSICPKDYTI